ncbi:MAG: DUF4296 domain-containing protein [Prevotella sp.]|nr:DUF4296 domain-containing protein [Prevotella sp.]
MRRRGVHLFIVGATVMVLLSACKPQVPSKYLQPDEMEDLMYDYYLSQGITNSKSFTNDYDRRYNMQAVLKKHGLTNAEFDTMLVYYYNHMELMDEIYSHIQKRLGSEALELGASEGEVERFTIQSVSGDTTDVWEGKRQLMLLPIPPYHIVQFTQKADTSFHKGDSFLLTFGSHFLVQSGSRNATAYLAVTYENDSVVSTTSSVNVSGGSTVRISPCSLKVKRFDGYFYMPRRSQTDNESESSVLLLNHIQLMRFHHREQSDEKKDGSTPPLAAPAEKNDTTDSLKPRVRRLGERPGQNRPVENRPIMNQPTISR